MGRGQQKAGKENSLQITITRTTHKSVGLLSDVMIHGLVFTKQKHTAAVGLPMQQGARKHFGVCISEQGYKKNASLKAVFMVLAAADRQLWENLLARNGRDREDLNKASSGLQISHELPHPILHVG